MSETNWTKIGNSLTGLYWISGACPVYDSDADDYGRTVGWPTGEYKTFVALAHVDIDFDKDIYEVEPINEYETGGWSDEHCITHYAPFEIPKPPTEESSGTKRAKHWGQVWADAMKRID